MTVEEIPPGETCPAGGVLVGDVPICNVVAAGGAILDYASGTPVSLTSPVAGVSTGGLIGKGASATGATINNGAVDITNGALNFATSMPRNVTITGLAGFFSITAQVALTGTATVRVEVYTRFPNVTTQAANVFTPTGVFVDLPFAGGVVVIGQTQHAETASAPVFLRRGTRVLVVARLLEAGLAAVAGTVSAGIALV